MNGSDRELRGTECVMSVRLCECVSVWVRRRGTGPGVFRTEVKAQWDSEFNPFVIPVMIRTLTFVHPSHLIYPMILQ